ncbi:MAG: class I SAM-dependent methyltransferase [Actinobacteria bacterium]|nr:MAG: class I SAM-dependent methyltransferase [Actinomycetota bacterium]
MRWLVYYLLEDLVPPDMAAGADILDFSAGLGDLSLYMEEAGARSVLATRPEPEPGDADVDWVTEVAAGNLVERMEGRRFDVAVARMVFQFPTWEGDRADPDTMLAEFSDVLRPGGRLVVAFHEFVAVEEEPYGVEIPDVEEVLTARPELARVVRYLNLPPREGPLGQTGFGLKVPMFISSLVSNHFVPESASHVEPFTFPLDLSEMSDAQVEQLGRDVMEMKKRRLAWVPDPYDRPARIRTLLAELSPVMPHVAWPVVKIVARRL